MKSLRTIEYAASVRRRLLWVWGILLVIGVALGLLLPDRPLSSALIGIGAATVVMGVSAFSISKMVSSAELGIGWLALDYVTKVVAIAVCVLIPRAIGGFNLPLIAGLTIAAILVTLAIQLTAVQVKHTRE